MAKSLIDLLGEKYDHFLCWLLGHDYTFADSNDVLWCLRCDHQKER